MLPLSALLNPLPESEVLKTRLYDVKRELDELFTLTQTRRQVLVPTSVRNAIHHARTYFAVPSSSSSASLAPDVIWPPRTSPSDISFDGHPVNAQYNVRITRETQLQVLYQYKASSYIEYPTTSDTSEAVGHLFEMDPKEWSNPLQDFAYAQGRPSGASWKEKPVFVDVLRDAEGKKVPCRVYHFTCMTVDTTMNICPYCAYFWPGQGVKTCEFNDPDIATTPHCEASRDTLKCRRDQELALQRLLVAPEHALVMKTLAYFTAIKNRGCQGPLNEPTYGVRPQSQMEWDSRVEEGRRGHTSKENCEGTVILDYDAKNRPFVRCEHYNRNRTVDHFVDYSIRREMFETEYLIALFEGDQQIINDVEEAANLSGNGPSSGCLAIVNSSSVRVNCPYTHRNGDGELVVGKLRRLPCTSKTRLYEPQEEYRLMCPYVLVTCSGAHNHPIPLPTKTPPRLRTRLLELLRSFDQDLPDLTPRGFLRHASTKIWLASQLPGVPNPTLSDVHISLANRDHLRSYITQVQTACFPHGTGWEGLKAAKEEQDRVLPPNLHYIRHMNEAQLKYDVDDGEATLPSDTPFRVVLCMTPENSKRLLHAQYVQCDIGFKRIAGFHEFELGGLEPISRTALVFARVYLNCQSAAAHKYVFDCIDQVVYQDTGEHIRWRHLCARDRYDLSVGILQITADQHSGQAKGLGLHLQSRARYMEEQYDLHEPDRLLSSLSDYDHLRRVFRLCAVHILRNIQKSKAPDNVKAMMRSLICITHDNWTGTIEDIRRQGGKSAINWLDDKTRSKFAFPGMCWSLSFIPLHAWKVGDSNSNIIESLHSNANREGTSCSLLGGVKKGQYLDSLKEKDMKAFENTGI